MILYRTFKQTYIFRTEKTPTETDISGYNIEDFGRDIYKYKAEHSCRDIYCQNREDSNSDISG